ncbi:hypothetical protein K7X08_033991 [Anisodus acutangulus]|uniref:Uncharacterized protein n=1 Tax=Anisodus acutangulus TaxID=402998 RepID=A0A9Q1LNV4_9SOLA|nr:hypothetical protein K7X08_033991 [Anisodus acutangulus]
MDPARKEARIRATRERIEGSEERQQALRAEQEDLIRVASIPPFETVEADFVTTDSSTTAKERIVTEDSRAV